jgi:raffinose/stachyose/melibiose transport system substrate-binding protein
MKKQFIFIILIVALALSVGSVAAQDEVTIDWWHISTAEDQAAYWQDLADQFTEANPHVTIEITILENNAFKERLTTVMQAGDPPDLFQSWGGAVLWTFAQNGLTRDISPWLEGEWQDSFSAQAALNLYSQNGEYYGVPWTWGAVGMFYNKDLFEEAGLDPEVTPETWDEFLATVEALEAAGITPIALGNAEKWPGHFYWIYFALRVGGEDAFLAAYDRSGAFTDDSFVQAGQYIADLVAMDPFPEGFEGLSFPEMGAVFGNGEAAMALQGQWLPNTAAQYSESGEGVENLGFFPFPAIEGGMGNATDVLGGGDGIAVGRDAPDEAIEFLQFVTSVENQRAGAEIGMIVPTVGGAEDAVSSDPIMSQILEMRNAAPYFQLYYDQFLPPSVGEAVNDAVETLFVGVASPEEAAQAVEDAAFFELE